MAIPSLRKIALALSGLEAIDPNGGGIGVPGVAWKMESLPGMVGEGDFRLSLPHLGVDVLAFQSTGEESMFFLPVKVKNTRFNSVASTARDVVWPDKGGTPAFLDDVVTLNPGLIRGFNIRTTATTIVVGSGVAVTDNGILVEYAGGTITSSRANNTTYHIYIQSNGIILRTTSAPTAPFFGTARGRSVVGCRYLGSVRTGDGAVANNYIIQQSDGGDSQVLVNFLQNTGAAPLVLHAAGSDTTATDATAAALAPAGPTNFLRVRCYQNGGVGALLILGYNGGSFNTWTNLPIANQMNTLDIPCDGTPKFQYLVTGAATASLNLMGYGYAR